MDKHKYISILNLEMMVESGLNKKDVIGVILRCIARRAALEIGDIGSASNSTIHRTIHNPKVHERILEAVMETWAFANHVNQTSNGKAQSYDTGA
jgi:hypothetical protein